MDLTNDMYLSEVEAREMMKGFNDHLSNSLTHLDKLKKSYSQLQERLSQTRSYNASKQIEIEDYNQKVEQLKISNESQQEELAFLKTKLEIKHGPVLHDDPSQTQNLLEFLLDAKQAVLFLQEEQNLLKQRINFFKLSNEAPRECTRCRTLYSNQNNDSLSCQYHPGKLRYYSCKKCNADAYYTCCSMCSNCSVGCKFSSHIS